MNLFSKFTKKTQSDPLETIELNTRDLYSSLGSWPPHFNSEGHKIEIFDRWKRLVEMAQRVYEERHDLEERCLCLLADLFRMGHNMDVQNSAQNAFQAINICLGKYPNSIKANLIAAYFFVSLNPQASKQGETCLLKLRDLFKPEVNPEVERWYLFAQLSQNKIGQALTQADYFLATFGHNNEIAQIKESIVNGKCSAVYQPGPTPAT